MEDWDGFPDDAPPVVAVGGDLSPATLVAAYRAGAFPWPSGGLGSALVLRARNAPLVRAGRIRYRGRPGWALPWFSPDPRAVFLPERILVSRSLRATLRRRGWLTTVDAAFEQVIAGCADRPGAWITPAMARAYTELHRLGAAHSLEVWSPDEALIGGLYGVSVGRVFSGESMFHRRPDASKVALVDLGRRLRDAGGLLIDSQSPTDHLIGMGQQIMPRADFRRLLRAVRDDPVDLDRSRQPAARLAD
jgi:leucyl/phenylalanyl-tRNA--protein transferase